MEVENNAVPGERRQELRSKYLTRLQPALIRHGLSHLKIDDLARSMGISKATFYKYFSSKEDVFEQGVELMVSYFKRPMQFIEGESSSPLLHFQNIFAQSLLLASYFPDTFLLDMKQTYPLLWERVQQAQQERQQQLQQFYEEGIALGIFHPINPVLVMLQNELLLRNILDPLFLMEHDVTLRALLYDYYELQKYQWLSPEIFQQIEDTPIKEFIDKMARKISSGLRSDR
ncbi:MAG TPA: TetR/AcrR family transcriptional regulator [Ktedonobacteraceae bacterium]|nr:TetR/AcrR family transcriptional regulator [Ktedonobacteraceae bacterium]